MVNAFKEITHTREPEDKNNDESKVLYSASIDETNKIREKLGLAPLREGKPKDRAKPAVNSVKNHESRECDHIALGVSAREQLLKEPSIASIVKPEDLNIVSWVRKIGHKNNETRSKRLLTGRLCCENEEEDEEPETQDISSLRTAHDLAMFQKIKPGEDVVLTLEDTCILNRKGELEDKEVLLENRTFLDEERRKKRFKERLYDPVDSNIVTEPEPTCSKTRTDILPHYDEWSHTEGGLINPPKRPYTEAYPTLSQIRSSTTQGAPVIPTVSLTSSTGIQRDIMNAREHEEYCNKKKVIKGHHRSSRKELLNKMIKRKRKTEFSNEHPEQTDDAENNFILPLLANQQKLPISVGSDDVDLEYTLLYAQLSTHLPRIVQVSNEKASGTLDNNNEMNSANVKEDPAIVVLKNVSKLSTKDMDSIDESSNANNALKNHTIEDAKGHVFYLDAYVTGNDVIIADGGKHSVELSDITEFCRTLETPLEKLKSSQETRIGYRDDQHTEENTQGKSWRRNLLNEASGEDDEDMASKCDDDELSEEEEDDEEGEHVTEEEKKAIYQILDENILDGGVASALKFLKSRGQTIVQQTALEDCVACLIQIASGELNDNSRRKRKNNDNAFVNMASTSSDIRLEYKDEYGRVMTPKEAFRYISWVFHGKGPGKRKREKLLRRMELEKKLKGISSNPSQLLTMKALRKQQKQGQAHLVLSRAT